MKAKTKKKLERAVVILLVLIFIIGTIMLYLPLGNQTAAPTPQTAPQDGVQAPAGSDTTTGVTQTTVPDPNQP